MRSINTDYSYKCDEQTKPQTDFNSNAQECICVNSVVSGSELGVIPEKLNRTRFVLCNACQSE